MAQLKAIFIGRDHPDTGLREYRRLAKLQSIKLDEYLNVPNAAQYFPKYDIAFVSRYLAILEALKAGVAVFAHYNNGIKLDYLCLAPFAKFITIFKNPEEVKLVIDRQKIMAGKKWANTQTWEKVTNLYEQLWSQS